MFILYDADTNQVVQQDECPGNLAELQMVYGEMYPDRKLVLRQVSDPLENCDD